MYPTHQDNGDNVDIPEPTAAIYRTANMAKYLSVSEYQPLDLPSHHEPLEIRSDCLYNPWTNNAKSTRWVGIGVRSVRQLYDWLFKGLLTKSGYITKIKKITGSCTQTAVISCLTLQNGKKVKCSQDILGWMVLVVGWYFQTPTGIVMSVAQPMKAHVIDQSLNESIVISYHLLPPANHHQLTGPFAFHKYNDRLCLANQKPNTNCITSS